MGKKLNTQAAFRLLLFLLINMIIIFPVAAYVEKQLQSETFLKSWQMFAIFLAVGVIGEAIRLGKRKGMLIFLFFCITLTGVVFLFGLHRGIAGFGRQYVDFWWNGTAAEDFSVKGCMALTELLISIPLVFLIKYPAGSFRLRLILAVGFVVSSAICLFLEIEIPRISICAALLFALIIVIEWIQQKNKDKLIIYLVPFFLLFFIGFASIPVKDEPYQWEFFKRLYTNAREFVSELSYKIGYMTRSGKDDFSIRFVGFSSDAEVGGDIAGSNREVMQIKAGSDLITNIYLIGTVYDTFDGQGWSSTEDDKSGDYALDFKETLYAVSRYDAEHITDYVFSGLLRIAYNYFKTKYIFYPAKTFKIDRMDQAAQTTRGGTIKTEQYVDMEQAYWTYYLQMNLDAPQFYDLIKAEMTYTYQPERQIDEETVLALKGAVAKFPNNSYTNLEAELYENAARIKEVYGQAPELSEAVKDYVDTITAGCTNDIDKLKTIEAVLQQYVYTTTPGAVPKDKEFMDYFLLESREGYCTYFATAFVLLARYEGFPARYVQGFCVPLEKRGEQVITVSTNNAHAWAEVYIEGVGWIPFEATPSYRDIRYKPWKVQQNEGQAVTEGAHYEQQYVPPESFLQDIRNQSEEIVIVEEQETANIKDILQITAVLLGVCTVVGGAVLLIGIQWSRRSYQKLSREDKVLYDMNKIVAALDSLSYRLRDGETFLELTNRVNYQKNEDAKTQDRAARSVLIEKECICIIEGTRYGVKSVTDEEQRYVEQQKWGLVEQQKKQSRLRALKLWWQISL